MLTIDQFMWEWQPHFRISVQTTMERALSLAEAHLNPEVFLVGFADDPATVPHPICIEPETGLLQPNHLAGVDERAREIFDADPESRILHSNADVHESRQQWLLHRSRGTAIAEAVEASGTMPGRRVLCSAGGHVAGFDVHVCVGIDSDRFDALPTLVGEEVNRFPAPSSFIGHLISLVLTEGDHALGLRSPGMLAIRRRSEDLVADAADSFVAGCSFRVHAFLAPHLLRPLTQVAQRAYETAGAAGRLLLVSPDDEHLEIVSRLTNPVGLGGSRGVRKLLETTDDELALLVHDGGVYGLGRLRDLNANAFEIEVVAHATWELRTSGMALLRVSYGIPTLPTPTFDVAGLVDALQRILGADTAIDDLLPLVDSATRARHGTTLVISSDAESEARRLAGQATLVSPEQLSAELLSHYARIDGAILVDPNGICHAIGVILDGEASTHGDPSRGARYNSAVRYQRCAPAATLAIVVSEDGDVVHVPSLRPRVRRQEVSDAMTILEAASSSNDPGQFGRAHDVVRRLAFYLSPEQCDRVNELAEEERSRRLAEGGLAIVWPTVVPDEGMDGSYFLD